MGWRGLYPELADRKDEFDEEAVSHILGRILSDYQTQLDLANELEARREGAGRSFLEAVLDTLAKVLRWLANWGNGRESRMLFHEYDDVRRKVVKTLADYAELKGQLGENTSEIVTDGNGLETKQGQVSGIDKALADAGVSREWDFSSGTLPRNYMASGDTEIPVR